MDPMETVPWDVFELVMGRPGAEIEAFVERHTDAAPADPGAAEEAVYDAWNSELGGDRTVPAQGVAFLVALLLEEADAIDLGVTERRPSEERLREWFLESEWTCWYIAVKCGVHYCLVTRWCYEADVPLLWRTLAEETRVTVRDRLD